MTVDQLLSTANTKPMERLRWTVLKAFGVLPSSAEARTMSDDDCLRFAAHMLLDRAGGAMPNPNFDMEKYLSIRETENGR